MAKDKLTDYDATASNNTDVGGISVAEGMLPSGVNNAIREQMSHLADFASGTSGVDVLKLQDDTDTNSIKLQAPASVTADTTFTMPDGDGSADQVLKTDGSGQLGFADRHANPSLIINGAMTIDQRNGGSSVTPTADQTYVLDRFGAGLSVASKFSLEQATTVPAGFKNSMKATVVSAYTPGASEWFGFFQKVEGLNTSHLDFGTSNAKTLTLSFWVRSSVTGDYGFSLANSAQNRAYPVLYNISAADTWEYKTITIAGDTSGTWLTTNGIGLILLWSLGAGSSYLQTADAWGAGLGLGTTGQTNWITNAAATFYITGVKLEVGETATPFDHSESYGETLAKCQRYYQSLSARLFNAEGYFNSAGYGIYAAIALPVEMRSDPDITPPTPSANGNTQAIIFSGYSSGILMSSVSNGAGSGYIYWSASTYVTADAEL